MDATIAAQIREELETRMPGAHVHEAQQLSGRIHSRIQHRLENATPEADAQE